MNARKRKRFAIIISVFLVVSLIVSGLTVFADSANGTQGTEENVVTQAPLEGEITLGDSSEGGSPINPVPTATAAVFITQPVLEGDVTLGESGTEYITVIDKATDTKLHSGDSVELGTVLSVEVKDLPIDQLFILHIGEVEHRVLGGALTLDFTLEKDTIINLEVFAPQTRASRIVKRTCNNTIAHFWNSGLVIPGPDPAHSWSITTTPTVSVANSSGITIENDVCLNVSYPVNQVSTITSVTLNGTFNAAATIDIGTSSASIGGNFTAPSGLTFTQPTTVTGTVNVTSGTLTGNTTGGNYNLSGATYSLTGNPKTTVTVNGGSVTTPISATTVNVYGNVALGSNSVTATGNATVGVVRGTSTIKGATMVFSEALVPKDITLTAGNYSNSGTGTGISVVNGKMTSGTLTVGGGKLTLHGTPANQMIFTGITVSGGTLVANQTVAGGIANSGPIIVSGGTLSGNGTTYPIGGSSLSVSGGATVTTININVGAGTLNLGAGTITGSSKINGGVVTLNGITIASGSTVNGTSLAPAMVATIDGTLNISNQSGNTVILDTVTGKGTINFSGTSTNPLTIPFNHSSSLNFTTPAQADIFGKINSIQSTSGNINVVSATSAGVLPYTATASDPTAAPTPGYIAGNSANNAVGSVEGSIITGSTGNIIIHTNGNAAKTAGTTISAHGGTAHLVHASNKVANIEANKTIIYNTHTAGAGRVSSKAGTDISGSGDYNLVFAGGVLTPTTSTTARIGYLYAGSDIGSVNITGNTFTLDGWKVGTFLLGGYGQPVTAAGDIKLVIGNTMEIGYSTTSTINGAENNIYDTSLSGANHTDVGPSNLYLGGHLAGATVTKKVIYAADGEKILGNVFGGGRNAGKVTEVDITLSASSVAGSLYGGGNNGAVGDVKITVTGGALTGTLYGGGIGSTAGDVTIEITSPGTINDYIGGDIYGGGAGGNTADSTKLEILTNAQSNTANSVFGGGLNSTVTKKAVVIIGDITATASTIIEFPHNVYGGGNGGGNTATTGSTEVAMYAKLGLTPNPSLKFNVFGGGSSGSLIGTSANSGSTKVTIGTPGTVKSYVSGSVYGGGSGANVYGTTDVTIAQSVTGSVFGGGLNSDVSSNTTVTVAGTVGGNLFGGGHRTSGTNGNVAGATTVSVTGSVNGTEGVFGGGLGGNVTGTRLLTDAGLPALTNLTGIPAPLSFATYVNITSTALVPNGDVHGGGNGGAVGTSGTGNIHHTIVLFNGKKAAGSPFDHSIYGGGTGIVYGNTYVQVLAPVANNTTSNDNHIFGGGDGAAVNGKSSLYVNVTGDIVSNIYGGGKGASTGSTVLVMKAGNIAQVASPSTKDSGNIFGGGLNGAVTDTNGGTEVYFTGGKLTNNIYGGTDTSGTVGGAAIVYIGAPLAPGNTVYGGARNSAGAPAVANTRVEIAASVFENVYGGGYKSATGISNVKVTGAGVIGTPAAVKNLYGGGEDGNTNTTNAILATGTVVNGHVYGSGNATTIPAGTSVGTTNVLINGTVTAPGTSNNIPYLNVTGNVHGGSNMPVTRSTNVTIGTGADVQFVFGGGSTAGVATKANVTVLDGTVHREVYGGGNGQNDGTVPAQLAPVASTNVHVIAGTLNDHIYGGGFAEDSVFAAANYVSGNTEVRIGDRAADTTTTPPITAAAANANIANLKNVYGGGNGSRVDGTAKVIIDSTVKPFVGKSLVFGGGTDNYYRSTSPSPAAKQVYVTTGATVLEITATGATPGAQFAPFTVFAGGQNTDITTTTKTTMTGGEIRENLYGGGLNALVIGGGSPANATTISITGGTVGIDSVLAPTAPYFYGSVYGGGYEFVDTFSYKNLATVTGNTIITFSGGKVNEDIFGGGRNAEITGSTNITMTDPAEVVNGSVYGGGDNRDRKVTPAANYSPAVVTGDTSLSIGGKVSNALSRNMPLPTPITTTAVPTAAGTGTGVRHFGSVYGGGATPGANVNGSTSITLTGDYTIASDVYGGGFEANVNGSTATATKPVTKIQVDGSSTSVVNGHIYGGGDAVHNLGQGIVSSTVQNINVTKITVNSKAPKQNVYGGGWRTAVTNGNVDITTTTGSDVSQTVYGGGLDKSPVNGNTHISLSGDAQNVFGGGELDSPIKAVTTPAIPGNTHLEILGTVRNDTYGGGWTNSPVAGDTVSDIYGTVINDTYGAGWASSSVHGNTYVNIDGTVSRDVYGGGRVSSSVLGTTVPAAGTTTGTTVIVNGAVGRDTFGGGIDNSHVTQNADVTVNGIVMRDTFGGGTTTSNISNDTVVTVNGRVGRHTYGGGTITSNVARNATVHVTSTGIVGLQNILLPGDVYGGGNTDSNIGNDTHVTIDGLVARDTFGGGINNSKVARNAKVDVSGTVTRNVFGGGTQAASHIGGYTVVDMLSGSLAQNVLGGGWIDSDVNGINTTDGNGAKVTIHANSEIFNDVYGAGWNKASILNTNASTLVTISGKVRGSVYGGGLIDSTVANATVVDIYGLVSLDDTDDANGNKIHNNVYGGGNTRSAVNTSLTNGTTVTIHSGAQVAGNVFGGGTNASPVQGVAGTDVTLKTNSLVGQRGVFYEIAPSYLSYPAYQVLTNTYPSRGNVYGGGTATGSVSDNLYATPSNVDHVNGQGTYVKINDGAHASGVIYGGGYDSDVITPAQGTSRVLVEGQVTAVHGGGRQGQVDSVKNGSKVHITGPNALVYYDVYGGGYAEARIAHTETIKTDVLIDKGANVRERVFGGGHMDGAEIRETTNVVINDPTTYIGHKELLVAPTVVHTFTGLAGNVSLLNQDADKAFTFYNRYTSLRGDINPGDGMRSFNAAGSIYGGGNNTNVLGQASIVVDNNHRNQGQKTYDRISGGNLGAGRQSNTAVRNIKLLNFGQGDYITACINGDIPYCSLEKYAVVRFLQDYTEANIEESFLTVYYNLKSYDDGTSLLGGQYTTDYTSKFMFNKGVYHPWRPEPNVLVRIEPEVRMSGQSVFRVRGGYTIQLENGIFIEDFAKYQTISLRIDLKADHYVATTTKIYSTANNVKERNIFRYNEVPSTINPKNITYITNDDVRGVNFYIPPQKVKPTDGNNTNSGGSRDPDRGTGSASGGGFGGGFGGGGALTTSIINPGVAGATSYITLDAKVVDQVAALKQVSAAITASAKKAGVVVEREAGQISGDTLRAMQRTATTAGGSVRYFADTVRKPNFVEGRMYIEPSRAANIKGNISTGVYVHQSKIQAVTNLFAKYFKNKVAIIHLTQQGELGMQVEVAARVDLTGLNMKNLMFYSYSIKTNSYVRITAPNYSVDKNGYLHFNTTLGGDIIVTDQELQHK